jgi:diguanylate cyclase (GGDEF)-like protein
MKKERDEETDDDRLSSLTEDGALSLDLVSALAGDRQLTDTEKIISDDLKKSRGGKFFSDLLYVVTHQFFSQEFAQDLWSQILRHKHEMSAAVKRNVRITVASLDYLTNLTAEIPQATVISEDQIAKIARLSFRDRLTGLFNHAYCYQRADAEIRTYVRYGKDVSVMMIDVDDFKMLNDSKGHQEGDRILALLGATIQKATRETDCCCRYGGEEFAVILPSTGREEASVLADRLRAIVAQGFSDGTNLTISIGVASCGENVSTSQILLKKADDALYQAKALGKNKVVISP